MAMTGKTMLEMYRTMLTIRGFEDRAQSLFLAGEIPGFIHLYAGEEAIATGVMAALRADDLITSTHRGHGHLLAKGGDVKLMMAELYGRATGYCKGKGGSMHIADPDLGILGANGIVGAGMPIATGAAFACKYLKTDRVAVAFFGDGASNRGTFHEALNLASLWKLPVVFVCENNGYGEMTRALDQCRLNDLCDKSTCYGVPGRSVDGNDVVAVHEAAEEFVTRARSGEGPALLECKTWRHYGHYVGDPGTYKDADEQAEWLKRDPIPRFVDVLLTKKWATQDEMDRLVADANRELDEAVEFARSSGWPGKEELLSDVYSD